MSGDKNARRVLVIGLVLVAAWQALVHFAPQIVGKDYVYLNREIAADVRADGSMRITDTRTIQFTGQYSRLEMWIPQRGPERITEVTVGEPGRPYVQGDSAGDGVYSVREEADKVVIRYGFAAADEQRTFIVSYTVTDAVAVHNDVAELYWQFIGAEVERPTASATVLATLPAGADDVRAWGHGPLHGEVAIEPGGRVTWKVAELPARTMLEGRAVFATASVPAATRHTGQTALPSIVAEETEWAAAANLTRQLLKVDVGLAVVVPLLTLFVALRYWLRYGRDPRPDWSGPYYRELPGDYTPADLTTLLGRNPRERLGPALAATLLDLNRRGHVQLLPVPGKRRAKRDLLVRRSEPLQPDVLLPHEQRLLTLLFGEVAAGAPELRLATLARWFRRNRPQAQLFARDWQAALVRRRDELGFWRLPDAEERRKKRAQRLMRLSAVALAALLVWQGEALLNLSRFSVWPSAIALFVTSTYAGRSQLGANHLSRWRAFRRFLLHFSRLDLAEVPAVVLWEHYLVFATVLGIARKVLVQMKKLLPRLSAEQQQQLDYLDDTHPVFALDVDRLTAVMQTTDAVYDTFASAVSSIGKSSDGSGGGGGFSAGGGDGGGGGGERAD